MILSVMQHGKRYRAADLALLTKKDEKAVLARLANLVRQGRVKQSILTTRSGHAFLYERTG